MCVENNTWKWETRENTAQLLPCITDRSLSRPGNEANSSPPYLLFSVKLRAARNDILAEANLHFWLSLSGKEGGRYALTLSHPMTSYGVMRLSQLHIWQCPWEIGSASAERAGQGEVGGCTRRVQTAWPCLGSALNSPWLEPGRAFLGF